MLVFFIRRSNLSFCNILFLSQSGLVSPINLKLCLVAACPVNEPLQSWFQRENGLLHKLTQRTSPVLQRWFCKGIFLRLQVLWWDTKHTITWIPHNMWPTLFHVVSEEVLPKFLQTSDSNPSSCCASPAAIPPTSACSEYFCSSWQLFTRCHFHITNPGHISSSP